MQLESARALKQEVLEELAGEKLHLHREAEWFAAGGPESDIPEPHTGGIVVGVSVGIGGFGLGIRLQSESPDLWKQVERISTKAAGEVDVRVLGPVFAQCTCGPIRSGISVGHVSITAGTAGPFVVRQQDGQGYLMSNNHVLAASNQGRVGDVIIHPGPSDGGSAHKDRIGTLAWFASLNAHGTPNEIDAAACLLDGEVQFDHLIDGARITAPTPVTRPVEVVKYGRSTGKTTGRVTLIESETIEVGYGPLGKLVFRNQIEVRCDDGSPFSLPGDSGSLVFEKESKAAVGLLFAGGVLGGNYATLVNPLNLVLDAFGATLA